MKISVPSGRSRKIVAVLAALVLLAGVFTAGMSFATHDPNHVTLTGKGLISRTVQTSGSSFYNQTGTWTSLSGSGVSVTVPSGSVRLVTTRFTATAACSHSSGSTGSPCHVRVMAKKSGSSTAYELYPRGGDYFEFAQSPGYGKAHAIDRSIKLNPGTWTVYVQVRGWNTDTSFTLEGWSFTVDKNAT